MPTDPITGEPIPGVVIAVFAALLLACLAVSALVVRRIVQGQSLVAYASRRTVPWNIWHLLGLIFVFVVASLVASLFLVPIMQVDMSLEEETVEELTLALITQVFGGIVAAVVFIGVVRPRRADLGLSSDGVLKDVLIGLAAFAVIGPWLYGLNTLLAYFHSGSHPLIEAIEESRDAGLFIVATLFAVLVAPVMEEFIFRLLLQGWLERVLRPSTIESATGSEFGEEPPFPGAGLAVEGAGVVGVSDVESPAAGESPQLNPFASPDPRLVVATGDWEAGLEGESSGAPSKIFWPPIIISSILFALVHLGHGPAPVPLFFLALLLGYLFQRTHRILPCIALHMALNAFSMGVLWLSLG